MNELVITYSSAKKTTGCQSVCNRASVINKQIESGYLENSGSVENENSSSFFPFVFLSCDIFRQKYYISAK